MTITHRRIIYVFFILIFLLAAPIIILRVSGYRFNFTKRDWQKTGMIFLETKPSEANVYLDGALVASKTPARLKDLAPNKYTLRIEKDGFQNWEKAIQVTEGQTKEIQYIRLFRSGQAPKLLVSENIILLAPEIKNNQVLALANRSNDDKALLLIDLVRGESREIKSWDEKEKIIEKIEFIDNGARAAVYSSGDLTLVGLNSAGIETDLREKLGRNKKIDKIKMPIGGSESVYYINEGTLKKYSWSTNREETILSYEPVDYLVDGSKIYFLDNESLDRTILKVIDQNQSAEPRVISSMERGDYQLAELDNNFLTISNEEENEILVVDLKENKNEWLKNASFYQWSDSGTEMLFGNNYELWVYRPLEKQNTYTLFTRVSNKIEAANWYPVESHIFYAENGSVRAVENIEKDGLTFEFGQCGKLNQILINDKGDKLFFFGEVGKTRGLYELDIQ
ncbi:PEGA domain-containing protein [Candidatus Kuenenbacteria bacterium]|nr:PEGA domain-containing protein [Candidatus Kuenenbacteria bacterium]